MSEMIERVAKALETAAPTLGDGPAGPANYMFFAITAVQAMREPTDAMLERAKHTDIKGPVMQADKMIYQAMIDEALRGASDD